MVALVNIVLNRKLLFLISLILFFGLALLYLNISTPVYKVSTSLVIDPSDSSRLLTDRRYADGGKDRLDKDLSSEINALKSYSLMKQTLLDLPFGISCYSGPWYNKQEHFGYFPIEVEVVDSNAQLLGTPIKVEILSDLKYKIDIKARDFFVSNPGTGTKRQATKNFTFSQIHYFDIPIVHDYFSFIVRKPKYNVAMHDFEGNSLFFEINDIESLAQSYLDNLEINPENAQAGILNLSIKSSMVEREKVFLEKLSRNYIGKVVGFDNISNAKVLDEPRVMGRRPVAPRKAVVLLLAALVGLIIPFGWIVISGSLEGTIMSRSQLEACSDIPVAASIAHYQSQSGFLRRGNGDWRVEESFRDLSASLQFLIPDKRKNIIGVTSTVPDEGKTFVATNLAMSLAKAGRKVLIIDSDFRNPSVGSNIESNKQKDLADFLLGNVQSTTEITHAHTEVENLYFIPTFLEEDNPHRILSSFKWSRLLQDLSSTYDYIVIDSPALGLVSDYLLISKYIDIHLFVTRRDVSKPSYLVELEKLKRNGGMENIFLIFNDAYGKSFKYGYSGYQYGHT